ncbi:MAG: hypothetical protein LBS25_06940 [Candidatus Symbiothrix sp.]|jgi:hypothetical protein|nr:hypothetical protein [Candidatus Symbiothrix sp.]
MKKTLLTILSLISVFGLSAQWNPMENHRVTAGAAGHFEAKINKDGITFVAFWQLKAEDPERQGDRHSDGVDQEYLLQIIDKAGNNLFSTAGKLISDEPSRSFTAGLDDVLFIDSDGNALYIVKDERNNNGGYPDQGYFVYKVSPAGEFLWEEPVDLDKGYAYFGVYNIHVTQIADGSYIFAHDVYVTDKGVARVVIDRVSKNGEFEWEQSLELSNAEVSYSFPYVVDAGSGNFIVVYSKGPGIQMYAQKYGFDKEALWVNETAIYRGGFTSGASPMTAFRVTSDANGGVFAFWYDDRYNSKFEEAYVSHILSNGKQGFVIDGEGLQVSRSPSMRAFRPGGAYDAANEVLYVIFEEDNGNQGFRSIVLQKVTKEGELLWTDPEGEEYNTNGFILDSKWAPEAVAYYSVQLAGDGKIAVFYQRDYMRGNDTENVAVLLDVSGDQPQTVWNDGEWIYLPRGTGKLSLTSLPLVDNEYFITLSVEGGDIFAQKVPLSGPTAIEPPAIDKADIAAYEYFDLMGRRLNVQPDNSLFIEKTIKKNGSVVVAKRFFKR